MAEAVKKLTFRIEDYVEYGFNIANFITILLSGLILPFLDLYKRFCVKGDLHRRQNTKSLKSTIIVADIFFKILSLPLIVFEIINC